MDDSFTIKSVRSDAELAFVERQGDYFTVVIRGSQLSATHRVWGYTDCDFLVQGLNRLAREPIGFNETFTWDSIEGDLSLGIRCDKLGHVLVQVELQERGGEDWHLKCEIETELGQLPTLAADAARFFGKPFES
jgi:hypothetical protein